MNIDLTPKSIVAGGARPATVEVDVREFLSDLSELDATDAQKLELLEILWSVMTQFVKLGFSVDLSAPVSEGFNHAASAPVADDAGLSQSIFNRAYGEAYKEQCNE